MDKLDLLFPIFPMLYAEMHYTLRGFSLIYRKWPEILSDSPHRVEPGESIPLLLLVKDAHRYPVELESVIATIMYPDGSIQNINIIEDAIPVEQSWWYKVAYIRPKQGFNGVLLITVQFRIRRKGKSKIRIVHTDNYRGTSHAPLEVFVAEDPYPRFDGWYFGDLHYHSDFTHDQTEFGAPLDGTVDAARAIGLDFAAVTDHSYDLDDFEDDYLRNDPDVLKWERLHKLIGRIEQDKDFIFIPGEEVSCGNARGKNVHLLLLNNSHFFAGSGDSAEQWFNTKPEHTIDEILDKKEEGSLAFAAHPEDAFTFLHRWLLGRGKWRIGDYNHHRLNGLQILNGVVDKAFRCGVQRWIDLLLQGKKLSIIAGNDAHGNFNRFRQLGLPFLYFRESKVHFFGWARTAVFIDGQISRQKILDTLVQGSSYVTTGPALLIEIQNEKGERSGSGGHLEGNEFHLHVRCLSTEEFGSLKSCKVWMGYIGEKKERLLKEIDNFDDSYEFDGSFDMGEISTHAYIRGELNTNKNGQTFFCLTNPIWLNSSMC
jgi:hypothetical protein